MSFLLLLTCLGLSPQELLKYHEARATTVLTVLLQTPTNVSPQPPQPSPTVCTCNGTKRSGDGIGPCICAATGGCRCVSKSPALPVPPVTPAEPVNPEQDQAEKQENVKQILLFVIPGCASCKATEKAFPELRQKKWKIGPDADAHIRVVDLTEEQPDWILEIGRLTPADDTILAVQAVYIEERQAKRRTPPGQALSAKNITDLYYGTQPVRTTRYPDQKQHTPADVKQHLLKEHAHELPAGLDLETLSVEELEQLHTALHNMHLVTVTRPVIRHGKIRGREVIQQSSRPEIPAEWFGRKRPDDHAVEGIRQHEIYGVQEYVAAALDKLWEILSDGGQLSLDLSRTTVERYVTVAVMKRAGLEFPTTVKMIWKREGDLLRITFTGDKPKAYFKLFWKSSVECTEITITKEKAVLAIDSAIVPDQTIIFKTGTP